MTKIIQYNPSVFDRAPFADLHGMHEFRYFSKLFTHGLAPVDRTETIALPFTTKNLSPIPVFEKTTETFENVCNERAREILARASSCNEPIYVMWSGGIDSTLLLISLLKHASAKDRDRITVLMTEASIAENPDFYEHHIRRHLKTGSANGYALLLGGQGLFVSGEQNDQLFGFDSIGRFMRTYGDPSIHERYEHDRFFEFLQSVGKNEKLTTLYIELFERIKAASPIHIETFFDTLWWINFTLKWQNAWLRSLSCTPERNIEKITPSYIESRYVSFYGTDAFQLWSMNNLDKRIKDEWRTYKWICKDIIYEYDKNKEYRDNKTKRGSLRHVTVQQATFNFIDDQFHFFETLLPEEIYVRHNDFSLSA